MRKGLIIGSLVLQAVVVAAMVYIAMEPLRSGRPVVVTVSGVDPRDLMRGQYVELAYPFSRINLDRVQCDLDRYRVYQYGDIVYVSLSDTTDPEVTRIGMEKPADGIFLKGRVNRRFSGSPLSTIEVEYGIESYFTNPDRATELDKILRRTNSLRVRLMVDDDGDVRIADLEEIS